MELFAFPVPTLAGEKQDCVRAEVVLWGDGRHDDTAALDAWWRGAEAVWGTTGKAVGAIIAGHSFRLSSAIYVAGGSGRRMEDFRLLWPERGEIVSGGIIAAGTDPDQAPAITGVSIKGGDPDEGKPFETPSAAPGTAIRNCATS